AISASAEENLPHLWQLTVTLSGSSLAKSVILELHYAPTRFKQSTHLALTKAAVISTAGRLDPSVRRQRIGHAARWVAGPARREGVASPLQNQKPTIARIWRGRTPAAKADEYEKYNYEHGIRPLEQKALAVQMMREDRGDETEFVTISYWERIEAMSRFAGSDPRRIHHLERDAEFLIELPQAVQVLKITASKALLAT